MTPLMILLTNNWLLITQRVAWVTCERDTGAGRKAAAVTTPVDRDAGIEARVRLHFDA